MVQTYDETKSSDTSLTFGDKGSNLEDDIKAFFGISGADAALEAAVRQAALGREALGVTDAAQARLEETLAPFLGVGSGLLGTGVFGPDSASSLQGDPAFRAALERQQAQILAQQAAAGRLGTDETRGLLTSLSSQLGSDFLGRQRRDVLGGLQLGQSSAAQQAAAGLGTGQQASDILTQIGNVTGAGAIGAQQAQAQGFQNAAGLATGLLGVFASERHNKRNIRLTGIRSDGVKMYRYQYKWSDKWYTGAMVDENPHAVV
ncbi:MAG: hypothetical protein ACN2B6_00830, partial [Rickettsiales bacterium]